MDADNMSKWETKMIAAERRILITKLVGDAMKDVMAPGQDSMRISAFERTGCFITFLVNDLHDNKIRPHGTKSGSFKVPVDESLLVDNTEEENIRRLLVVPPPQDEENMHHTLEIQLNQLIQEDTAQDDGSLIADTNDDAVKL
jgi:hypothetical protein